MGLCVNLMRCLLFAILWQIIASCGCKGGNSSGDDCNPPPDPNYGCKRRYHVNTDTVILTSWYVAKAKCEAMNMRLVSIENEYKYREVIAAIKSQSDDCGNSTRYGPFYWTSGRRDAKGASTFSWGTGRPFTFAAWWSGYGIQQPDNDTGEDDCVEIYLDFKWNDYPCDNAGKYDWQTHKNSYICESLECL